MNYPFFKDVNPVAKQALSRLPSILAELFPMNSAQKKDLVYACRDLSEDLTSDRQELSKPYWTSQRLLSAYLHYFLPWNLLRMVKLFPALNLGKVPDNPLIVDMGSGPLTLPIALWLARPDLRKKAVTFVCADIAPQPLSAGKKIFEALLREFDPNSPWKIHTMKSPLFKVLRQIKGDPWLITMANVLNEGEENKRHPIQKQIRQIIAEAHQVLREDGKLFAIEPGTRQGARVLSILRQSATQFIQEEREDFDDEFDSDGNDEFNQNKPSFVTDLQNHNSDDYDSNELYEEDEDFEENEGAPPFMVLSPCPHNESCPLATSSAQSKFRSAWCHFNTALDYVPSALRQLSQKAGLDKNSLSFSFVYLAKPKEAQRILEQEEKQKGRIDEKARIISEAFSLPQYVGRSRYACHEMGLLLLVASQHIPAGSLCDVSIPKPIVRDQKSKAAFAIVDLEEDTYSYYLEDYQKGFDNFQESQKDRGGDFNSTTNQNKRFSKKNNNSKENFKKKFTNNFHENTNDFGKNSRNSPRNYNETTSSYKGNNRKRKS